jgi:CRISPR system Cascade subunit CasE
MTASLHLVQFGVDSAGLARLARKRALDHATDDTGYLVHSLIREVWAGMAPAPFSIGDGRGRWLSVLGYSRHNRDRLAEAARENALPEVYAMVDWASLASKPMPAALTVGRRLAFRLRACPVRRRARGAGEQAGVETDAFLLETRRHAGKAVDRDVVYRTWLKDQLERGGAASDVSSRVRCWTLSRLVRRGRDRTVGVRTRPDVTFEGELRVAGSEEFARILARGVGRHRAFGFGMLLVRSVPIC